MSKFKYQRLERWGRLLDFVVFVMAPLPVVAALIYWILSVGPASLTTNPLGSIIVALPISGPASGYYIFVVYHILNKDYPVILGGYIKKKATIELEEFGKLPFPYIIEHA